MVKIRFASKEIKFQKTLKYQHAINLCYERQKNFKLQGQVPNA